MNDTLMGRDEGYIVKVISGFMNGKKIQFSYNGIEYIPVSNPCWNWEHYDYRLA